MYSNVGHSFFQLHPVLRHRVFSYRAEQRLCHHPHAGLSTDSHLFPADFRLPYHAHTVCRRFGSGHFSHCSVFPVQELSAIQACKLSVSRIRIYRNGESAFSATDILCSRILIGAYSFQSLHPKSFFRFAYRLERTLLVSIGLCLSIRTHGFILPAIPGTGEFPLYPIWFPALGIGDNRVYTPFIYGQFKPLSNSRI